MCVCTRKDVCSCSPGNKKSRKSFYDFDDCRFWLCWMILADCQQKIQQERFLLSNHLDNVVDALLGSTDHSFIRYGVNITRLFLQVVAVYGYRSADLDRMRSIFTSYPVYQFAQYSCRFCHWCGASESSLAFSIHIQCYFSKASSGPGLIALFFCQKQESHRGRLILIYQYLKRKEYKFISRSFNRVITTVTSEHIVRIG